MPLAEAPIYDLERQMTANDETPPLPRKVAVDRTCLYIHRTAVVMADGETVACGNFFAEHTGQLDEHGSFLDVWNGTRIAAIREALNTPHEHEQCRNCWLREVRYHSNRRRRENGSGIDIETASRFEAQSWDF